MVPLRPNTQHFTTPCSLELLLLLLILLFSAEALELGPLFFDAAVVVFGIAFGVGSLGTAGAVKLAQTVMNLG